LPLLFGAKITKKWHGVVVVVLGEFKARNSLLSLSAMAASSPTKSPPTPRFPSLLSSQRKKKAKANEI
jgi:hypothetical protein